MRDNSIPVLSQVCLSMTWLVGSVTPAQAGSSSLCLAGFRPVASLSTYHFLSTIGGFIIIKTCLLFRFSVVSVYFLDKWSLLWSIWWCISKVDRTYHSEALLWLRNNLEGLICISIISDFKNLFWIAHGFFWCGGVGVITTWILSFCLSGGAG